MALPLSAVRVHAADVPANVICSRRKRAWLLITEPVRRWHSKQWHMEIRAGSPSMARLSWPQLQVARRLGIECSYHSVRRAPDASSNAALVHGVLGINAFICLHF